MIRVCDRQGRAQQRAALTAFERENPAADVVDRLCPHARQAVEPVCRERGLEVGQRRDAQRAEELLRGFHADARDAEKFDQRQRILRGQFLEIRARSGRADLGDPAGDRLADPGQLLQPARRRQLGDRRCVFERLGGPLVSHEFEKRLAGKFHERPNLHESLCNVRIR